MSYFIILTYSLSGHHQALTASAIRPIDQERVTTGFKFEHAGVGHRHQG